MNSSFVCSRTFYLFFLDTRNLFLIESCFFRSALRSSKKRTPALGKGLPVLATYLHILAGVSNQGIPTTLVRALPNGE